MKNKDLQIKEDAEYEKLEAEYYGELSIILDKLINDFNNAITKNSDIFYYGYRGIYKSESECKNYWENLQDIFQNEADDYATLLAIDGQIKEFIKNIIARYNRESYYSNVSCPKFIAPKSLPEKPASSQKAINFDSTQAIIEQICADLDLNKENFCYENCKNTTMPQILFYENKRNFSNEDLMTTIEDINQNTFFLNLLKRINKTPESLKKSFEKSKRTPGHRNTTAISINNRLKEIIAKEFNTLYGKSGDDSYRFQFNFEKEEISLAIFKGNENNEENQDVLELDLQSEGFHWFFNLYFSLLYSNNLKQGDIVIMDEPACNLSVPTRKECRKLLKEYGEKNGITFVIITHDPFLADIDHLDEIRIIHKREGEDKKGVSIKNNFAKINSGECDTLLEIKHAFGVGSEIICNPKIRKIFVEGITDYNYCTALKAMYQEEKKQELNLAFLPINGVGKESEQKEILEKLMKQEREVILLLDSDKPAKEVKKLVEEEKYQKLEIITLDDIEEFKKKNYKEIENLFDAKDLDRYGLRTKSSDISSAFKKKMRNFTSNEKDGKTKAIEDTTKNNFYKLLEHLNEKL